MKKIVILNKPSNSSYVIPILWMSAKTYYEENSQFVDQWNWSKAILDYSDIEKLIDWIINEDVTILALSNYVWNETYHTRVAREVKMKCPWVNVIWGGPQSEVKYDEDWFKKNQYVDLVIPGDAYGEVSFHDILNNIAEHGTLVADMIPYCYYPDKNRNRKFNKLASKKKDFKWPDNLYEKQKDHILPYLNQMHDRNLDIKTMMETSRGCPYKCSFCDWGGGTYTKTVKKPFATVMREIETIGKMGISLIYFADANFGMFSIDLEYAKKAVETKKKYGYPKQIVLQPTKVKLDQLAKIYEILAEADMLSHYQISIQDIDEDVKKNVDRIDFSFDEQVAMFRELQKKKMMPIFIEGILGLPGASIRTMKNGINKIVGYDLPYTLNYHWALLPETPANDPEYRSKMKLITIKNKSSDGLGLSAPIVPREDMEPDPGVTIAEGDKDKTEYVIGTFSYTPEDWIDMNFLQLLASISMNTDMLKLLVKYLKAERKILPADLFVEIISQIFDKKNDDKVSQGARQLREKFEEWIHTDLPDQSLLIHDDINFKVAPWLFLMTTILTNIDDFFAHVSNAVGKLTVLDDEVSDLLSYSKDRVISIDYLPGKTFKCEYDWPRYLSNGDVIKEPSTFILEDTSVFTGAKYFDMNWIELTGSEKIKQFIYRFCYDFKSPKIARKLTRLQ